MKLSEAILLGSAKSRQGFGPSAMYLEERCAMGSALDAIGVEADSDLNGLELVSKQWPWVNGSIKSPVPIPNQHDGDCVYRIIWMLNDIMYWTRPQIAAWIATIEPHEADHEKPTAAISASDREVGEAVS